MIYGGPPELPYVLDCCPSCGEIICECPDSCIMCGEALGGGKEPYCSRECKEADSADIS